MNRSYNIKKILKTFTIFFCCFFFSIIHGFAAVCEYSVEVEASDSANLNSDKKYKVKFYLTVESGNENVQYGAGKIYIKTLTGEKLDAMKLGEGFSWDNIYTEPANNESQYCYDFYNGFEDTANKNEINTGFCSVNFGHKINYNFTDSVFEEIGKKCPKYVKFEDNNAIYNMSFTDTDPCISSTGTKTERNACSKLVSEKEGNYCIDCDDNGIHIEIAPGNIGDIGNPISCELLGTEDFDEWLSGVLNLIRLASIILVIILTAMDGIKSFASFEDKNSKTFYNRLLIRLICLAIIFLAPSIIELVLGLASANKDINDALQNPFCNIL